MNALILQLRRAEIGLAFVQTRADLAACQAEIKRLRKMVVAHGI